MRKLVISIALIFVVLLIEIVTLKISDEIKSSTLNPAEERESEKPEGKVPVLEPPEKEFIENIHYFYSTSSYTQMNREIFILRNMMRIRLLNPRDLGALDYDTVYLNFTDGAASAYCEDKIDCLDRNKPFNVSFDEYYLDPPSRWVEKIKDAENLGSDTTSGRKSLILRYSEDDRVITVWLNEVFRLPNKVEVKSKSETKYYYFTYLDFDVKQEEVAHQKLFNYRL